MRSHVKSSSSSPIASLASILNFQYEEESCLLKQIDAMIYWAEACLFRFYSSKQFRLHVLFVYFISIDTIVHNSIHVRDKRLSALLIMW